MGDMADHADDRPPVQMAEGSDRYLNNNGPLNTQEGWRNDQIYRTQGTEILRDHLEGSARKVGTLDEAATECLHLIDECDFMSAAVDERIKQLQERSKRLKARRDRIRDSIYAAMSVDDVTTLKLPEATVSLGKPSASIRVTDQAQIDASYFDTQPPKLNRKRLLDDLKVGVVVDGAELSNGAPTLKIRRS